MVALVEKRNQTILVNVLLVLLEIIALVGRQQYSRKHSIVVSMGTFLLPKGFLLIKM